MRRILVSAGLFGVSFQAQALTFEQLRTQIETEKLYRVEQVLARLPAAWLANFTLVYDSHSLQDASLAAPRVLLFGRDAKLIITFNGEPTQKLYDALELLQWREASAEFELRSITFSGDKVRFSERNPKHCLSCHGQVPRPIWGSYDYQTGDREFWPGFYGSVHDAPRKVAAERDGYLDLRARAPDHPRYRYLKFDDAGSSWYPYGKGAFEHRYRPNDRLGNLLARLNANRIAGYVRNSEFMKRHRDLVLTWLLQCPQAQQPEFAEHVYQLFVDKFPRSDFAGIYAEYAKVPEQLRLPFLLEKLLTGLEVYTWNMSIATEPVLGRFSTGILAIDQLVTAALLPWLLEQDPRLRPHFRGWTNAQVYDTFRKGYYQVNVRPGGVGAVYDELGRHYDEERLKGACSSLYPFEIAGSQTDGGGAQQ